MKDYSNKNKNTMEEHKHIVERLIDLEKRMKKLENLYRSTKEKASKAIGKAETALIFSGETKLKRRPSVTLFPKTMQDRYPQVEEWREYLQQMYKPLGMKDIFRLEKEGKLETHQTIRHSLASRFGVQMLDENYISNVYLNKVCREAGFEAGIRDNFFTAKGYTRISGIVLCEKR